MVTKNILILLAVVSVLGGAWWLTAQYSTQPLEPQKEEEASDLVFTATPEGRHYAESTDLYSIDITYPTAPNAVIQARVDEIVREEVDRFKRENIDLIDAQEADRLRQQGRHYELIVEHKAFYTRGAFISYEFDIYLDTGGAHPNAFYRTATFRESGEELLLEDLFVSGAPYLTRLSEEAYPMVVEVLRARVGGEVTPDMEDTVRIGTSPSPEALQFFYLKDGELHLLFPPYQVAAYAAGSFDIAIPLSELQDTLNPEVQ